MWVVDFYSLRRDGLQVAVLVWWVVANAAAGYGFGKTELVALGVYDWGTMLVLIPFLVEIVPQSV